MEKRMLTPAEVCDFTVNTGITKTSLKTLQMLILGILAGAYIAFGGFVSTLASHGIENYGLSRLVTGAVFPVGLMLVIMCGAELFTGNSLITVALYDKKVTIKNMLKNWIIVYIGNFIGSVLIALLVYYSGALDLNGGKVGAAAIKIAANKGGLAFTAGVASGILCNILVCLAVWGAFAARDIAGKIFIIWFPIMTFVTSGFEHSIANMYYFALGILAKSNSVLVNAAGLAPEKLANVSWANGIINNLIPVTIGNIIGGTVFVALSYWLVYRYVPSLSIKEAESSNTINKLKQPLNQ